VTGEPMRNVSGVTGAAPVWLEVMMRLHEGVPSEPPSTPTGLVGQEVAFTGRVEPARREWFQRGTEPAAGDCSAAAATGALARIVAPVARTILALDPDIPAGRQRVPFEARDTVPGQRWLLDGAVIGEATELLLWPTASGRQENLVSEAMADGRVMDAE